MRKEKEDLNTRDICWWALLIFIKIIYFYQDYFHSGWLPAGVFSMTTALADILA